MRRAIATAVALTLSGCVTKPPQLPNPRVPTGTGSTDWSAVEALPRGEFVVMTLDAGETRRGTIVGVTDTAVTIWDYDGQFSLPRSAVERVVLEVQIGTKRAPGWVRGALVAAILGGFVGVVANYKNGALREVSLLVLLGAGITAREVERTDIPRPIFDYRVVYIRP